MVSEVGYDFIGLCHCIQGCSGWLYRYITKMAQTTELLKVMQEMVEAWVL
jgi:hypothetical protein